MLPILDRSLFEQPRSRFRWHDRISTFAAVALAGVVVVGASGFFALSPNPTSHAAVAAAALSQAEPPQLETANTAVPATTTLLAAAQLVPEVPQPLVVAQALAEPAPLAITNAVTRAEFEASIASLRADLISIIANSLPKAYVFSGPAPTTPVSTATFAYSQKIDQLSGTSLSNITVSGVTGLTDADIPDGITASNYVPLSGGVLTASTTIPYTAAFTGALQRSVYEKLDDIVSVKDFGAKGDGITDDTSAIQTAVDLAATDGFKLFFPKGTYIISSAISVTGGNLPQGFGLIGNAIIKQATDNIPILNFDVLGQSRITIDGISLSYENLQPSSNTSAVCMLFSGGSSGSPNNNYNSEFKNLNFAGCYIGIGQEANQNFWGNRVEHIIFSNISGSAIDLTLGGGSPNNYFSNLYANASANTDAVFQLSSMAELTFENVEVNNINNSQALFISNSRSVLVRNFRVEIGSFDTNYAGLLAISGVAGFQLDGYEIQSVTFDPTNYNFGFRDMTPSSAYTFDISNVNILSVTANSKFYLASSAANSGRVQSPEISSTTGYAGDIYPYDASPNKIITGYSTISPWASTSSGAIYFDRNVGVGTTSPTNKLEVAGNTFLGGNLTATGTLSVARDTTLANATTTNLFSTTASSTNLFSTIASFGSLGIGTTNPGARLDVSNSIRANWTGSDSNVSYVANRGATSNNAIYQLKTNGATNWTFGLTDASLGTNSNDFNILDGSGNSRFHISNSGGNIGIATTTPWRKLSVTGTVGFDGLTGATGAGSLCLSANREVVYNSGSDACLPSLRETKHDITALSLNALEMVDALDSVSFVYNDGDGRVRYGFIAEDTAAVDSRLVTYSASGTLSGIDDRSIISIVVKAIQELRGKIASILDRLSGHDAQIAALEARLAALETSQGAAVSQSQSDGSIATPDTETPVITINGNNPATLSVGDTYADLGATVTDNLDLNLGLHVFVGSTPMDQAVLDTSEPNEWHIHYVATDNAGNTATSTRTVIVEAPSIVPADTPVEEPEDEAGEEPQPEEELVTS